MTFVEWSTFTQPAGTDLILRVADEGERLIKGMIAPWDKPTRVLKPIPGLELFKRGAFDKTLADTTRRIPLMVGHQEAVAAVLVDHDNRYDGQHATFRALHTRDGDDALELIREGVVTGLSVGGWQVEGRTTTRRVGGRTYIERAEMRLDHVGLVRHPAYEDARVLMLNSAASDKVTIVRPREASTDPVAAAIARLRLRDLQVKISRSRVLSARYAEELAARQAAERLAERRAAEELAARRRRRPARIRPAAA